MDLDLCPALSQVGFGGTGGTAGVVGTRGPPGTGVVPKPGTFCMISTMLVVDFPGRCQNNIKSEGIYSQLCKNQGSDEK